MQPMGNDERLSRITTMWTLVQNAHERAGEGFTDESHAARAKLLQRYCGAAHSYLRAAVGDDETADELFQEFALKFFRGDFRQADAERGRFRQFLKTALINLVRMHVRRRRDSPRRAVGSLEPQDEAGPVEDELDNVFFENWRNELIARAWAELAVMESEKGQPFFTALRARAQFPDLSSAELAARINKELKPARIWNETSVRKLLSRARAAYADLLLREVSTSLENPPIDRLRAELCDLGLFDHCRSALKRRQESTQ